MLVNPKGNQSWIFIGRTDAEAETPILWLPDTNSQILRKGPDAGKDWSQEEKMTENKMVWWHHWLNGCEFEQTPGDGEGQGSLVCFSAWGRKESDMTERPNNSKRAELWILEQPPQVPLKNFPLYTGALGIHTWQHLDASRAWTEDPVEVLEFHAGRIVMPLHSSSTKYPRRFTFDSAGSEKPWWSWFFRS